MLENYENRILPKEKNNEVGENEEVTKMKYRMMTILLDGYFDDIDPKIRPTILDFQGLGPESKEEDFLKWIEKEIEISRNSILENGSTNISLKVYSDLNYAYQQGKNFLRDTLKYRDEEVNLISAPKFLSSQKDIFSLLNKTVLKNKTNEINEVKGLNKAPLYCRLVKATIIAYETLKNDAKLLKLSTETFEKSLIAPISKIYNSTSVLDTPLIFLNDSDKGKKFCVAENNNLKGYIKTRGKDIEKLMLRFLTRPESNAEVAFKDGIASRITLEKEQILKFLPILCEWLLNKKTDFLILENNSLFSEEKNKEIKDLLLSSFYENNFSLSFEKPQVTSMGSFEAFTIKGIFKSPEKNDKFFSLSQNARKFEIQLVAPDNKNEKGRMDHYVYDVFKFITARTRLDGGCPEDVFYDFVKDASNLSGKSEKKIISYLLEGDGAPIIKVKRKDSDKNKKTNFIYKSIPVYSRWAKFGWIDFSLERDTKNAMK